MTIPRKQKYTYLAVERKPLFCWTVVETQDFASLQMCFVPSFRLPQYLQIVFVQTLFITEKLFKMDAAKLKDKPS